MSQASGIVSASVRISQRGYLCINHTTLHFNSMTQSARTTRHQSIAQGFRTDLSTNQPPVCSHEKEAALDIRTGSRTDSKRAESEMAKSRLIGRDATSCTGSSEKIDSETFELLSAYMDGETSEEESQQVERWLSSDEHVRQAYEAQLKLSQAMKWLLR